jgi:predicted O-methyltransferase YrrM
MAALLAASILLTLAALAFIAHKARRIHRLLFDLRLGLDRVSADVFRQVESLQALYLDLRLTRSLPPTRGWAASPDFLAVLMRHVRRGRPGTVVECGSGVSTLVLARSLQLNGGGHVYSLEHLPEHVIETRALLNEHGVGSFATVLESPLRTLRLGSTEWSWYSVEALPQGAIDMLVVDGPPWTTGRLARYPAGPVLFPRLSSAAVVILDDAGRADERAALARWREEYPALSHEKVECEKGCAVLRSIPSRSKETS